MRKLHLNLCPPCTASIALHNGPIRTDDRGEGFLQLPPLCPECGGKVAQVIRLIVAEKVKTVFE